MWLKTLIKKERKMKIFNLNNNKVDFDVSLLIIPEFKKLWDGDKTKTKDVAFKKFAYIYFLIDSNSPYSNFPLDKRKELLLKDMFKGEFKEDAELLQACKKYADLSVTPTQNLLFTVKNKINEIADFLNNTSADIETINSILKVIESTSKLISQLTILEDAVNKEKSADSEKRSGAKRTRKYED
jgi:hypothetical protein